MERCETCRWSVPNLALNSAQNNAPKDALFCALNPPQVFVMLVPANGGAQIANITARPAVNRQDGCSLHARPSVPVTIGRAPG